MKKAPSINRPETFHGAMNFQAYRSAEIWAIFERVFDIDKND